MRYEVSTQISAPLERVWAVLTDVQAMPGWTSSMTRVQRLEDGPLAVGSTARLEQPRLPPAVWHVTELVPERSFVWSARSGGITTEAGHTVVAGSAGGVTVTLSVRQSGPLVPLTRLFTAGLLRRYVDAELHGLKARSESTASSAGLGDQQAPGEAQ